MIYHVITPFSRPQNTLRLEAMLEQQRKDVELFWHPICHDTQTIFTSGWINPIYCAPPPGWNEMYWKLNHFIQTFPVVDDHRFCVLCDDDFYEPDFFKKLEGIKSEVGICSMKRGDACPPTGNGHPPTTLVAAAENMRPTCVGMEQLIVSGAILKKLKFDNISEADGKLISEVTACNKTDFVPDAFVWFNYLEPGRWK